MRKEDVHLMVSEGFHRESADEATMRRYRQSSRREGMVAGWSYTLQSVLSPAGGSSLC